MKSCFRCGSAGPFGVDRSRADGLMQSCKPCMKATRKRTRPHRETMAIWRARQPKEKMAARAKHGHLKRKYGITLTEHAAMMVAQSGTCALCKRAPATDTDHCHSSKRVRALLCNPCNMGLGSFRDDPALLIAAIAYLAEHQTPTPSAIR